MPKTSSTDMAIKAAAELTHTLQNPTPASPFHKFGDETLRALDLLREIFSKSLPIKEEITNQQSTTSHTETITAPRVKKTPPKLDNIHKQPIEEHVSVPRVKYQKRTLLHWTHHHQYLSLTS